VEEGNVAESTPPLLRVIRGNATAAETAALIAALAVSRATAARAAAGGTAASGAAASGAAASGAAASGAAASGTAAGGGTLSGWRDRARLLRAPPRHGPGAWRASALPH